MNSASARDDEDRLWSARMAAAQGGDRGAYEALLRDCVPFVKRIVRGTGVGAAEVEDVVQEVLLTVHRARATYDPARSFPAWLAAIARRRAIDELRRRGRQHRREVPGDPAYETHAADEATPEAAWEESGRAALLGRAVEDLPPRQREAVRTLALGELSLAEASAATGSSKGALKVNLHRGLKALRERLERIG